MPDDSSLRPDASLPRGEAAAVERRARQAQARQRRASGDAAGDKAAERGAAADIARS